MGGNDYFSVTAMFVMFRECMEAAVIMAVLLQYVARTGKTHLRKQGKRLIFKRNFSFVHLQWNAYW
jgi:high-affinity Fe2+/Pb2+ permease